MHAAHPSVAPARGQYLHLVGICCTSPSETVCTELRRTLCHFCVGSWIANIPCVLPYSSCYLKLGSLIAVCFARTCPTKENSCFLSSYCKLCSCMCFLHICCRTASSNPHANEVWRSLQKRHIAFLLQAVLPAKSLFGAHHHFVVLIIAVVAVCPVLLIGNFRSATVLPITSLHASATPVC